jgi:serine/threonine protein kinase
MDGLFKKVIKGAYQKIGDHYSKALSSAIKSMLQVNPSNRPSANQLLINLESKAEELHLEIFPDSPELHKELLQTIRVNKNLHYLTDRLPKSNYANGHEHEKVQKLNQSTKVRPVRDPALAGLGGIHHLHANGSKNINLPKLDKIIIRNNISNYRNPVQHYQERNEYRKAVNIDVSNLLKIEGRNNARNEYRKEY